MDLSLPAAKAALHRGRAQLREIAEEPEDAPLPKLSDADRDRLGAYVAHFNARDFDAIRAMIADDVRLELVNKTRMNGKAEVSRYFGNYSSAGDWHLVPGLVEGHPAILVFDPNEAIAFSSEVDTGSRQENASNQKRTRSRNISCCWAGRPTRSRPSGTSAMRLTSSTGPTIASHRQRPFDRSLDDRGRSPVMLGQVTHGIFAAAQRCIHDLLMLGGNVARVACPRPGRPGSAAGSAGSRHRAGRPVRAAAAIRNGRSARDGIDDAVPPSRAGRPPRSCPLIATCRSTCRLSEWKAATMPASQSSSPSRIDRRSASHSIRMRVSVASFISSRDNGATEKPRSAVEITSRSDCSRIKASRSGEKLRP